MNVLLFSAPYPYPWAAMAELTPNTVDVLTSRLGSLRQLAHQVTFIINELNLYWNSGWLHTGETLSVVQLYLKPSYSQTLL